MIQSICMLGDSDRAQSATWELARRLSCSVAQSNVYEIAQGITQREQQRIMRDHYDLRVIPVIHVSTSYLMSDLAEPLRSPGTLLVQVYPEAHVPKVAGVHPLSSMRKLHLEGFGRTGEQLAELAMQGLYESRVDTYTHDLTLLLYNMQE